EQLKIRGHRIEPREVELALEKHPAVRRAVVTGGAEGPGAARLVAYVEAGVAATADGLRRHLEALLPAYMVPAAYVRLDALPLTAHGKVDRAALPQPLRAALAPAPALAPRSVAEAALAEIWRDVLRLDEVGVD